MPAIGFETGQEGVGATAQLAVERVRHGLTAEPRDVAGERRQPVVREFPASFESGHPFGKLVNAARELSHKRLALARCSGSGRGASRRSRRCAAAVIAR